MRRLGPYDVLGVIIEIRASTQLAEKIDAALIDLRAPSTSSTTRVLTVRRSVWKVWTVSWRDEERYVGHDENTALYDVLGALNEIAGQAAADRGSVGVHGGSVSIEGRGVMFVGHSGAGKSTLTAAMVLAGHAFVADEISAVTPSTSILPFHRPIGLRAEGAQAIGHTIPAGPHAPTYPWVASRHGKLALTSPLSLIVFPDRTGAGDPVAKLLAPADALYRLCNQTLGTDEIERKVFRRLEQLVDEVPAIELRYGEALSAISPIVGSVQSLAS